MLKGSTVFTNIGHDGTKRALPNCLVHDMHTSILVCLTLDVFYFDILMPTIYNLNASIK